MNQEWSTIATEVLLYSAFPLSRRSVHQKIMWPNFADTKLGRLSVSHMDISIPYWNGITKDALKLTSLQVWIGVWIPRLEQEQNSYKDAHEDNVCSEESSYYSEHRIMCDCMTVETILLFSTVVLVARREPVLHDASDSDEKLQVKTPQRPQDLKHSQEMMIVVHVPHAKVPEDGTPWGPNFDGLPWLPFETLGLGNTDFLRFWM